MKHIKPGIFLFLLLVAFLFISCDAILNTNVSKPQQASDTSPEEIHANLSKTDRTTSNELEKAHQFEQENRDRARQNNASHASQTLPSQNLESEMMKAADTEFRK